MLSIGTELHGVDFPNVTRQLPVKISMSIASSQFFFTLKTNMIGAANEEVRGICKCKSSGNHEYFRPSVIHVPLACPNPWRASKPPNQSPCHAKPKLKNRRHLLLIARRRHSEMGAWSCTFFQVQNSTAQKMNDPDAQLITDAIQRAKQESCLLVVLLFGKSIKLLVSLN